MYLSYSDTSSANSLVLNLQALRANSEFFILNLKLMLVYQDILKFLV